MVEGSVDTNKTKEKLLRVLTVVTQAIEVYIFGGLIFGFNTLVYLLKKERIYSSLCDEEFLLSNSTVEISCNEQDVIFTEICAAGIVSFYVFIFSGGLLLDTYGLWLIRLIMSLALTTGGLSLAFSTVYAPLLWVVAIAWGGQAALSLLASCPIGNIIFQFALSTN